MFITVQELTFFGPSCIHGDLTAVVSMNLCIPGHPDDPACRKTSYWLVFLHYLAKIKTQKLHTFSVMFCVALLTNTHTWARAVSLYCGNVSSAGWQVTLCDPVWHVSSRSSEACYMLLFPVTLLYNVEWNGLCCVSITTVRVICVRCYTHTHTHTHTHV